MPANNSNWDYRQMENTENERLIWNRFLAGDNKAFSEVYQKYVQSLFLYGLQFTSDRELVKDSIHDLFVKLYNGRDKISDIKNLKVYLFVLLKNILIDEFRKNAKITSTDNLQSLDNDSAASAEDEFLDREEAFLAQQKVKDLLSVLTLRQRKAIFYRFIEGMDIKEICELMDMNYQSVVNLIQRALTKIRNSSLLYLLA